MKYLKTFEGYYDSSTGKIIDTGDFTIPSGGTPVESNDWTNPFLKWTPEEESDLNIQNISDRKAEIIKKYMDTLKEPYRTVIEMREIKKMAYQDIADKLDRNLSTIKSQIRNGRHLLISQSRVEFEDIDEMYM